MVKSRASIHTGFALGPRHHKNIAKRDSCHSGGFIKSPSQGENVDVSKEVTFSWDPSCLSISAADIYLYAPYESSSLVQMFQNVEFAKGSFSTTLKPKWWNSSSSVELELSIVETGDKIWQAQLPAGPIWTAKYDSSAVSDSSNLGTTSSSDSNVTKVGAAEKSGGVSKGGIAAAVLLPLIAVAIGIFFYIRRQRTKEADRRRTYHEKVDKRMSVISQDWRSTTVRGAEAAVRASMYSGGNNRSSVWSAGAGMAGVGYGLQGVPRGSSVYAVEDDGKEPDMAQIRRPGVGLRGPVASTAGSTNTRVSRVSFAADTRFSRASSGAALDSAMARPRPSGESRRTGVASRAFHSAYIPPVPARPSQYVLDDEDEANVGVMSPTQRSGPLDLSAEDIQARMAGTSTSESRPSIDGLLPALAMMRTNNSSQTDLIISQPQREEQHSTFHEPMMMMPEPDFSLTGIIPTPPEPCKSPIMENIPMPMPMPAPVPAAMSPDEMLRAYAAQRRLTSSTMASSGIGRIASPPMSPMSPVLVSNGAGLAFPLPVADISSTNPTPSGMRQLFNHTPSSSLTDANGAPVDHNPFRKSMSRQNTGDTPGSGF